MYIKQEMESKTLEIQKEKSKYQELEDQCLKLDNEMKPIENRLLEIRSVEFEIGKHQAEKVKLETK